MKKAMVVYQICAEGMVRYAAVRSIKAMVM